jgi:hypothetical protein
MATVRTIAVPSSSLSGSPKKKILLGLLDPEEEEDIMLF